MNKVMKEKINEIIENSFMLGFPFQIDQETIRKMDKPTQMLVATYTDAIYKEKQKMKEAISKLEE